MYQKDTEVLFPARAIQTLRDLRGDKWRQLADSVETLPENDPHKLAFVLLMIRLDGCLSCQADSFRALRGCVNCASQAVSRFKGSDEDLITQWHVARAEIAHWLETGEAPAIS